MDDSNGRLVTLVFIRAQVFCWLLRQVTLEPRLQRERFSLGFGLVLALNLEIPRAKYIK
jgi:hypothetical protein